MIIKDKCIKYKSKEESIWVYSGNKKEKLWLNRALETGAKIKL